MYPNENNIDRWCNSFDTNYSYSTFCYSYNSILLFVIPTLHKRKEKAMLKKRLFPILNSISTRHFDALQNIGKVSSM